MGWFVCLPGKILFAPKRRRSDEGLSHWTPSPGAGVVLTAVTGWLISQMVGILRPEYLGSHEDMTISKTSR